MKILRYAKTTLFRLFLVLMGYLIGILLRSNLVGSYNYSAFYFTWQFVIAFIVFSLIFEYLRDLGYFDNIVIS